GWSSVPAKSVVDLLPNTPSLVEVLSNDFTLKARRKLLRYWAGSRSLPKLGSVFTSPRASGSSRIAWTTAFKLPRALVQPVIGWSPAQSLLKTAVTRCTYAPLGLLVTRC